MNMLTTSRTLAIAAIVAYLTFTLAVFLNDVVLSEYGPAFAFGGQPTWPTWVSTSSCLHLTILQLS